MDVGASFCVTSERDSAPGQKQAKRVGFAALPKTLADVVNFEEGWNWCILHRRRYIFASLIIMLQVPDVKGV